MNGWMMLYDAGWLGSKFDATKFVDPAVTQIAKMFPGYQLDSLMEAQELLLFAINNDETERVEAGTHWSFGWLFGKNIQLSWFWI